MCLFLTDELMMAVSHEDTTVRTSKSKKLRGLNASNYTEALNASDFWLSCLDLVE